MSSEQDTIVYRVVQSLTCPTQGFIRIATTTDAENLFALINKAYDAEFFMYHQKGFQKRLDNIGEIHNLMNKGVFLVLTLADDERAKFMDDQYSIAACVFIHDSPTYLLPEQMMPNRITAQVNLLCVHPEMRNRGIARYMIQVVEGVCKEFHYTHVYLRVVSVHQHLIDMYMKLGFMIIGKINWEG
ncbi:unnamed protein product [Rotaria sp. Silwood1]|nr:unnamed protein product [Rotaria sp. Silwood1]